MEITVTCTQCGASFVPESARSQVEFKLRHGKPLTGTGRPTATRTSGRQPGNQDRGYQPEIYRAGWIDQGGMRCSRQGTDWPGKSGQGRAGGGRCGKERYGKARQAGPGEVKLGKVWQGVAMQAR